ncbi:hypothetical protein ACHAWX_006259 [Stephanocyclus meneghinianus]
MNPSQYLRLTPAVLRSSPCLSTSRSASFLLFPTNSPRQHARPQQQQQQQQQQQPKRHFGIKSPGQDPLELLKQSSEKRGFCDEQGIRKPNVHWTFGISTSGPTLEAPPALRTIDFQRITPAGIDFIRKRGRGASNLTAANKASSMLCSFGKYRTGEKVEQWVAEGHCEQLNVLGDDVIEGMDLFKIIPSRSIVELVASRLVKEEGGKALEDDHSSMDAGSHYMEVVQKTRNRLESGELTKDELDKSMMLVRFVPYRMERYIGGPDQVMWERWEWQRATGECPEGTALWKEPKRLLPY